MKKKVLLVIEAIGSGGAENQMCKLAVLLTDLGYECRLITYFENQFYEPYLKDNHVDYVYMPNLLPKKTRLYRMVKYIKTYSPDCVISFLPSVNKLMCLVRLFCKFNLIVSERNNEMFGKKYYFEVFNLYRMADSIVVNSHARYDFIKNNYSFLSDRLSVIVNCVDSELFQSSKEKTNSDRLSILIVGRFAPQKNIIRFLDLVAEIKNMGLPISFEWIGNKSYDCSYFQLCCEKIKKLNLEEYITFSDQTKNILEKYQKADAFCLPSLYEGYPNVILEAMCCELPILCGNVCENPAIVKNGVNGFLFDPYDVGQMVESVKRVYYMSPAERNIMGKRNRSLCLKRNSMNLFIKKYVRLIEKES